MDSEKGEPEDSAANVIGGSGAAPAASVTQDEEQKFASNCPGSGSGVWERSENRRWVVVRNTNHMIPSRTRARSEGSLDPCLSIQRFINNFDVEQPNNYNVVSDGNTVIRIDNVEDTQGEADGVVGNSEQEPEEDPMEGSSESQTRRVKTRARRRSSHLSSPEQLPPQVESVQVKARRRRRRKKKRSKFVLSGNFSGRKKRWKRREVAPLSVESSPGRDSPSPDTLRRIVERGLVVQGEGLKVVTEERDEDMVTDDEVTSYDDKTDITSHTYSD